MYQLTRFQESRSVIDSVNLHGNLSHQLHSAGQHKMSWRTVIFSFVPAHHVCRCTSRLPNLTRSNWGFKFSHPSRERRLLETTLWERTSFLKWQMQRSGALEHTCEYDTRTNAWDILATSSSGSDLQFKIVNTTCKRTVPVLDRRIRGGGQHHCSRKSFYVTAWVPISLKKGHQHSWKAFSSELVAGTDICCLGHQFVLNRQNPETDANPWERQAHNAILTRSVRELAQTFFVLLANALLLVTDVEGAPVTFVVTQWCQYFPRCDLVLSLKVAKCVSMNLLRVLSL